MEQTTLSKYVKAMRKQYNLTHVELSENRGWACVLFVNWSRASGLYALTR